MKRSRLMRNIGVGLCTFYFISALHAGIPLWSFRPDASFPPHTMANVSGTTTVKYTITNQSKKSHQLVIVPITGISQTSSCHVGPAGGENSVCTLTLTTTYHSLPEQGVSGGPVLCQANPDGTPNANQCYQPSQADRLSITVKRPINGLINMGNISFYNNPRLSPINDPTVIVPYVPSFSAMVINVTWDQLQPTAPGSLVPNNAIDQALESIQLYNQTYPLTPITAKLRVWGGFTAPNWAKTISSGSYNGPVPIDSTIGSTGTIGLFWTTQYISYWRALQSLLAARYDSNPLISEVAVTSCASNTDEPFVSWLDNDTVTTLKSYGYTDQQQETCLSSAIDDYIDWNHTMIDFTFNMFHEIDNTPRIVEDPDFTIQVMEQCQASSRCILSNHALDSPLLAPDMFVYTEIQSLYSNNPDTTYVDFQTTSPALLNWCGAIVNGTIYHGSSIELWPDFGGFTTFTASTVANLAYSLKNSTIPIPALCPPLP